ncbi:MAG: alpha/beta fold hydrolase [Thermodesulfobacteriota bacterium]|nr:alpha/beta fold hydrolase [Thermodesulfobacteriota bacterium]
MAVKTERIIIPREDNKKIVGILHFPENTTFPCVITCHGAFSSKDSSKFLEIARHFSSEGIGVFRFDFHGCGESDGELSNATLSERVKDLDSVLKKFTVDKNINNIGLLGSSMGGNIAIIKAAEEKAVKALVILSTPSNYNDLSSSDRDNPHLIKKYRDDASKFDIPTLAESIDMPILVIHGTNDETVPPHHAKTLFENVKGEKELLLLEGGDHSILDPNLRYKAISKSLFWFKKFLLQ